MCIWRLRYRVILLWVCLPAIVGLDARCVCADPLGPDGALADGALVLLPADTVGFLWIRRVEDADAKIAALLQQFGIHLPAPLKFLKFATGLDEGLDSEGDLLVALLPPEPGSQGYQPVVLIPVGDYGKLAASVRGDPSGEICRVTISGEDVLIAHNRSHALIMNMEHRATMERLLARKPRLLDSVRPLSTWLIDNDLAVVASPTGMKVLFAQGREGLDRSQRHFEQSIEQVPMEDLVAQARQTIAVYRAVIDTTDAQVEASALGVSIDMQSRVKVSMRLILAKTSEPAQFQFSPLDRKQLETGGQTGACVVALAGTMPKGWGDSFAKVCRRLLQRFPDLEGYGDFERSDWDKVEQSYRATWAGIQEFSFAMRETGEEEPLLSGFYGVLQVEDASDYLASYQRALKLNNELVERSTSDIKLISEFTPTKVADATGLQVVADIAGATGDQNNPFWQETLENLLGKDGKLKMQLLAVDKSHVLLSTAEGNKLSRFVRSFQAGNQPDRSGQDRSGRAGDSSLPTTLQWLEEDSSWIVSISPRDALQWFRRWMKAMMGGKSIDLPPFPATPPIGVSVALMGGGCQVDLVLPSETLNGFAEFFEDLEFH